MVSQLATRNPDDSVSGSRPKRRDSHLHVARVIAHEMLGVLLILYPLLLLLDSAEPGFVRSVVNPHAFLLALIVVATLAPRDDRSWSQRTILVFGLCVAVVVGTWVWWSVGRGTLGAVVGVLAVVGVGATSWAMRATEPPANGRV